MMRRCSKEVGLWIVKTRATEKHGRNRDVVSNYSDSGTASEDMLDQVNPTPLHFEI